MPIQYDSSILQKFADVLYGRARSIVFWNSLRYGIVALVGSYLLVVLFELVARHLVSADVRNILLLLVTFVGVAAGASAGHEKAFNLRLQAQQVLCQCQIELNTRPSEKSQVAMTQG